MIDPTDWRIEILPGEIVRRIMWGSKEVATVNSRGDFTDKTERDLAAGLASSAKMHIALRLVWGDMQQNGGVLSEIAKKAVIEAMSRVETIDAGVMIEPTGEEEGED